MTAGTYSHVHAPEAAPISADAPEAERLSRRYERAKRTWELWRTIWQECYDYGLPGRLGFYNNVPGENRTMTIFDDTGVTGLQDFSSRLAASLVPDYMRWVDMKAGSGIPPRMRPDANRQLAEVNEYMFEVIHNSNFSAQAHEALVEVGIGTGAYIIEDGDLNSVIRTTAVPLTDLILDVGPHQQVDAVFHPRMVRIMDIPILWPGTAIPKELQDKAQGNPDAKELIVSCTYRNWSIRSDEVNEWRLLWPAGKQIINKYRFVGLGSNPWVVFRWSNAAGEIYGRGPFLNVLSSVKTANLVVELILQNAEIAISGIWQYEDDGMFNPDTIQLLPGTFIPRRIGGAGLEPLQSGSNFDVSQIILDDQRTNIRKGMFDDMFAPVDKTPMSATEVVARQEALARRIGAPFGRLKTEMVFATVRRVVYLLQRAGRVELPRVDGRLVAMQPVSPLARAQRMEDIGTIDRFLEQLGLRYGPEMVAMITKPEETAAKLGELYGVPPSIIRTEMERKELLSQAQAQAAEAQAVA